MDERGGDKARVLVEGTARAGGPPAGSSALANVVLGWLSFLACSSALAAWLHPRTTIDARLDQLLEHRETVDTVFLGASYTQVGLVPTIFDAEMSALGKPTKSVDISIAGLGSHEQRYVLHRVLASDLPVLERIVLDVTLDFDLGEPRLPQRNRFSRRAIDWHTWENFTAILDFYVHADLPLADSTASMLVHARHLALNYLGVGRVAHTLADWSAFRTPVGGAASLAEPEEDEVVELAAEGRERRRRDGIDPRSELGVRYDTRISELKRDKAAARRSESPPCRFCVEARDEIRAHGYDTVFLLSPVSYLRVPPAEAVDERDALVVLDFDDPDAFPELYAFRVRLDENHLNRRGGKIFSRLLARALAAKSGE